MAKLKPEWRFLPYHRSPSLDVDPFAEFSNVSPRFIDMPGDRWHLWEEIKLPRAARRDGADLLHCPANSCPRYSRVPIVSTVHDLIPLKISDPLSGEPAKRFESRIRRCLKQSARVLAVSQSTKNDLISDLGGDPQRIDVLTWAADSTYLPVRGEAELAAIRSRYNIRDRYLLAFSGRSRRKNAEGMVRGFARTEPHVRLEVQFLVVGVEPQSQRDHLRELIDRLDLSGRCMVQGFVPQEDVSPLLSGAEALAFCSLYEGFGLPILDAFRCETPVLTSNVSSMPEVAGEAAVYCDPHDPADIAAGMSRILSDVALRDELVRGGTERVGEFTWMRSAEAICRTFEKCLMRGRVKLPVGSV